MSRGRYAGRFRFRAARVDSNQREIMDTLEAVGASVWNVSSLGKGFPDLVVGFKGRTELLEVKNENQPLSARKLTPKEERRFESWRGKPVHVVSNKRQALIAIGATGHDESIKAGLHDASVCDDPTCRAHWRAG